MDLWFVCYCPPRKTLALADALEEMGAKVFCPRLVLRRRVPRKNRIEAQVKPMISGVFFCRSDSWPLNLGRVEGIDTARIRRMARAGKVAVVKGEELEPIRSLALANLPCMENVEEECKKPEINPGDWVRVSSGPFSGLALLAMRVTRERVHTELNGVRIALSIFLLERMER